MSYYASAYAPDDALPEIDYSGITIRIELGGCEILGGYAKLTDDAEAEVIVDGTDIDTWKVDRVFFGKEPLTAYKDGTLAARIESDANSWLSLKSNASKVEELIHDKWEQENR